MIVSLNTVGEWTMRDRVNNPAPNVIYILLRARYCNLATCYVVCVYIYKPSEPCILRKRKKVYFPENKIHVKT